jgi:hypothetical protein
VHSQWQGHYESDGSSVVVPDCQRAISSDLSLKSKKRLQSLQMAAGRSISCSNLCAAPVCTNSGSALSNQCCHNDLLPSIRRNDGSNVALLLPPLECPVPCPYVNRFVSSVKRRFRKRMCQRDESPVFGFSMQPFTLSIKIQAPLHGQHRRALCFW